MKKRLTGYTFDASAQTVVHADFSDITLEGIQLIVNTTDQIIIYNFADTTKGGTLSTDTLTLEYDTTTMDDTDKLMILVDDAATTQPISAASLPLPSGAATSANQTTVIGHLDGVEGLLTTIDGDTGNISTKIDTVAGAVSGTEMQVDVLTMPTVTVTDGLNVEGDIAAAATDSGNPVKIGGKYNSTMPTYTNGQRGDAEITTRGAVKTTLFVDNSATAIAAAVTNADGAAAASVASRLETISRMSVFNGSTWDRARGDTTGTYVVAKPATSGGMTIFRSIDIDETEEDIKTSAGQLFSITAFNRTAAPLYLKFYNATAANVTVGTTTPVLTFVVPGNADSDGAGFIWNNELGFAFGTAISVACTTGIADNDTGAPGANDCVINCGYA